MEMKNGGLKISILILFFNASIYAQNIQKSSDSVVVTPKKDSIAYFYIGVDEQSEPVEGFEAFRENIKTYISINYPQTAKVGKVYVDFIVEEDGSLSNFRICKLMGKECEYVTKDKTSTFNKWMPAKINHKIVRQFIRFSVVF